MSSFIQNIVIINLDDRYPSSDDGDKATESFSSYDAAKSACETTLSSSAKTVKMLRSGKKIYCVNLIKKNKKNRWIVPVIRFATQERCTEQHYKKVEIPMADIRGPYYTLEPVSTKDSVSKITCEWEYLPFEK